MFTATQPLPAFRITYDNGKSYVTIMAKDVTLDQAREHFLGQQFEPGFGDPMGISLRVIAVDEVNSNGQTFEEYVNMQENAEFLHACNRLRQ